MNRVNELYIEKNYRFKKKHVYVKTYLKKSLNVQLEIKINQ